MDQWEKGGTSLIKCSFCSFPPVTFWLQVVSLLTKKMLRRDGLDPNIISCCLNKLSYQCKTYSLIHFLASFKRNSFFLKTHIFFHQYATHSFSNSHFTVDIILLCKCLPVRKIRQNSRFPPTTDRNARFSNLI